MIAHRPEATPAPTHKLDWATLLGMVLVGLNALYMSLVVFGNITDYPSNLSFVRHVLAMDTTNFGQPGGTALDPDIMWRAVTTPWIQTAAYLAVIGWEAATAVILIYATIRWTRSTLNKPGHHLDHHQAQMLSTIGLLMVIVLFFGGFIAIGGEWFAMYRSTAWNGLEPAFRNTMVALSTLVVIYLAGR